MQNIVSIHARSASTKPPRRSFLFFKRLFDIAAASVLLVLLFPLLLVVTLVATYDTQGSPFFIQTRMG
ncbi:MAG: sugar transferase, partial [Clostridia bacterium]|nr:sugar transferase [Clostridia bacterium]